VFADLFDSLLEYRELYLDLASKTPNVRFILINFPGQAFTQAAPGQVLNNLFLSDVFDQFLYFLNEEKLIDLISEQYSLIAYGNGSMTALFYTILINDTNEGLRSIILFNGITYIDKVMQESLSMCLESDFYW
jgi:hypothetical protein